MARRCRWTVALALIGALAAAPAAPAAGPGETFSVGALPLAPGVTPAGESGIADGGEVAPSVSADGRYVAFSARADTLSDLDDDNSTQVYRVDRVTGEVVLVSRGPGLNGPPLPTVGTEPVISADGGRVSFVTRDALLAADTDTLSDIYVRDIAAGTTVLASPGTAQPVFNTDLSGDGRYVVYNTGSPFPLVDANGFSDVVRFDTQTGTPALVSVTPLGFAGNGASGQPSISFDGRYVAFGSSATDLIPGFVNNNAGAADVFVRDLVGASTTLVSRPAEAPANVGADGESSQPDIAGQAGAWAVAYTSRATTLSAADADAGSSIYRRLSGSAASTLVSRGDGLAGANATGGAFGPAISADGDRIAFVSGAPELGITPDLSFSTVMRAVASGRTRLASTGRRGVEPAIAGDGLTVAWVGNDGVHPDQPTHIAAVFARPLGDDLAPGAVALLGKPAGATATAVRSIDLENDGSIGRRLISADGRFVLLNGFAPGLPGAGESGQVYRRDTLTGEIVLVSQADGAPADRGASQGSMSADGNRVVFESFATNLGGGVDGSDRHAFVRDIAAGTTVLVSRAGGPAGAPADTGKTFLSPLLISADGTAVAYLSDATNLGAADGRDHLYLRRLADGEQQLVDRADGPAGAPGDNNVTAFGLSADGRRVVFATLAINLGTPGFVRRAYLRDTVAATTVLVSRRDGPDGAAAARTVNDVTISDDGRVVAFSSDEEALVPSAGSFNGVEQIIVRDLVTHTNRVASRAPGEGPLAEARAEDPSLSADGSVVAFLSGATNLLPGRGGAVRDGLFVRDLAAGTLTGPPAFGRVDDDPQSSARAASLSANGNCAFVNASGHATPTLGDDLRTGYVFVVRGECASRLAPEPPPAPGPGPGPVGPGPGPVVTPPVRPALSRVTLLNRSFRVGNRVQVLTAAQRRRGVVPVGTRFRFRLSRPAAVRVVIQRRVAGKRVGRRCVAPRPALRTRANCARFVNVVTLRRQMAAGTRSIAFTGRQGRVRLRPGAHRARLSAVNAGGASPVVVRPFRVVPPAR